MDDVLAVMDAAGSKEAAICATLEGGPMAVLFGATHPDRTQALVLYATFARSTWAEDYEWAWTAEERDAKMDKSIEHWGEGLVAGSVAPSRMGDPRFMEWAGRLERLAASPGTIKRIFDLIGEFDVRDVLPSIRVPTLVMHRPRGQLHQGRALPLHRRAHAGRALRGAGGARTTCSPSATPSRSSARSRSSSPASGTSASPTACSPP